MTYLSGAEVARRLGLTRAAVYNAYNRGTLKPATYVGDTPVYDPETVEAWRNSRYKRRRNKYGEQVG